MPTILTWFLIALGAFVGAFLMELGINYLKYYTKKGRKFFTHKVEERMIDTMQDGMYEIYGPERGPKMWRREYFRASMTGAMATMVTVVLLFLYFTFVVIPAIPELVG
jgi:hypothetical protein